MSRDDLQQSSEQVSATGPVLHTVGHSTHDRETFANLLQHYGIARLVDVRTIPRSRHNPQFNRDELGSFLRSRRIGYRHMPDLGGLRHSRPDSINTGWHNLSFRGFADYMQTPPFAAALEKLIDLARRRATVIMCAEAVPWRCHRSLIADALLVRGVQVRHILSLTNHREHVLTAMARVEGVTISYPGDQNGEKEG